MDKVSKELLVEAFENVGEDEEVIARLTEAQSRIQSSGEYIEQPRRKNIVVGIFQYLLGINSHGG